MIIKLISTFWYSVHSFIYTFKAQTPFIITTLQPPADKNSHKQLGKVSRNVRVFITHPAGKHIPSPLQHVYHFIYLIPLLCG